MKTAARDPFSGPYNIHNRPLWSLDFEVDWFVSDVMKGKVAVGQTQLLPNGCTARNTGDGVVIERDGVIVEVRPLPVIEDCTRE